MVSLNLHLAEFVKSFGHSSKIEESETPEIVFSGRSNVGKSSLINKLVNRKMLARVSSAPGKTATVNVYSVDTCLFIDLPGYGFAKVSKQEKRKWGELIERYFAVKRNRCLCVALLDVRHPPSEDDIMMVRYYQALELPFLVAATKCDKLSNNQLAKRLAELREELALAVTIIPVSSKTGAGTKELLAEIETASKA